jgi:GTP pyrophosphokinase
MTALLSLSSINERCNRLKESLQSYDSGYDESIFYKALEFAEKAHAPQKRASGEPYFSHPLEVAQILADMGLDMPSVMTGLLHDTVEDTPATLMDIQKNFGTEMLTLVDGVTKLTRISPLSVEAKQAENFRKLVLAMSSDVRVLLIKLADRLHNMRTLEHVSQEKQIRISKETIDLYIPLAGRVGLHQIKEELEDLCFTYLYPEARESIQHRLEGFKVQSEESINQVIQELKMLIAHNNFKAEVNGRMKTPFSIWEKMQRKSITFEQMADIVAFRVIVETIPECYQLLGVFHSEYSIVPGRFKDFISTPKSNRYQSLHTCVIGPLNQRIEIQIRTHDMHQVAEYGVAAHWSYKQRLKPYQQEQYSWLKSLMDILEHKQSAKEALKSTRLQMFHDQVFCFTPQGDIISLPYSATPVDFAYAIHSNIGDKTQSARVNGRMVPLRTRLKNGDQVEVITSPHAAPCPSWERFVVTGKALARIRRTIRTKKQKVYVDLGEKVLKKAFEKHNFSFNPEFLEGVCRHYQFHHIDDLYLEIGHENISVRDVMNHYFLDKKIIPPSVQKPQKTTVPIKGIIPGMTIHFAGCCHPLPGDRIVGISAVGRGVKIHHENCRVVQRFMESDRLIPLQWEEFYINQFTARLRIGFDNHHGSLAKVIQTTSEMHANIVNIRVISRTVDTWHIILDIEVKDLDHVLDVVASLRVCPVVNEVERA